MIKRVFAKQVFIGAVLPILLVASGLGLFFGMKAPPPPQTTLPRPVPEELLPYVPQVDVAMVRSLAELSDTLDLHANGTVVPYRELEIGAPVAGKKKKKPPELRSGNYVSKGQLLYRIDPRDYELEVQRLTRRRDQEQASLRELDQDIENTKALLDVAEQELALANKEVERLERLDAKFSSAAELDQARRSRLAALNQQVTLRNQLRTLETRRDRMLLTLQLAETELEQARLNLERTAVTSPVEARIVSEQVEVDSYVQRGTPLIVLEDTSKVEVACNLRMDQLLWVLDQQVVSADDLVNAAQAARFELPRTPAVVEFHVAGRHDQVVRWDAVLERLDGAGLDPQSRTVPVRVRVDDPNNATDAVGHALPVTGPPVLVRGMFVDVVVKARPGKQLYLVPKLAIKPSTEDYDIWKFRADDQAIYATAVAKTVKQAELDQSEDAATSGGSAQSNPAASATRKQTIDPAEWQAGFLQVIHGVRVVSEFRAAGSQGEYWICEVPSAELAAGDFVITSPVPGIRADGTDPVRTKRENLQPPANRQVAEAATRGEVRS
ncbi:MAG: biotin/lipoyl-binding protein [Planctomycetota bacterium]|nr:MAG: biotin/lipoyl-binding protein [Planctomycetota bacterium]